MSGERQTPTPLAVLFMAYGTPATNDDIEAFYTHIRGGRPPSPEALAELKERYERIGGSPLARITRAQAEGTAQVLNGKGLPYEFKAFVGMKHSPPFVRDTVEEIVKAGFKRLVGITLTPQYSRLSVGGYISAVQHGLRHAGGEDVEASFVEYWHLTPLFIEGLARRVEEAIANVEGSKEETVVLFTAHSLPKKILEFDDPYPRHLEETARAVAEKVGLRRWHVAYQSEGQTAIPWLGPDMLSEMERVAAEGAETVVICPAGFVADHLEVLYDIDIEAQEKAEELGVRLGRTESLNDSPDFLEALASALIEHLEVVPAR